MSTQSSNESTNERANPVPSAASRDLRLEMVIVPVSDVERAKRFYQSLGWRLDADFANGDAWRVLQMTPPGSASSVMFGKGLTTVAPGSLQGTFLVVDDIEAARAELLKRDVAVSEVFHFQNDLLNFVGTQGRLPGPDPERRSYFSFASFNDPDGNGWLLQEITTRFPGRGLSSFDVATMTELLRETEKAHGDYERSSPKHHWSGWYAGYMVARQQGQSSEDAVKAGTREIEAARR
jgi:catechol 2,3-dioxygenase-like lactoylglutathione lyase family enzyme